MARGSLLESLRLEKTSALLIIAIINVNTPEITVSQKIALQYVASHK